MAIEPKCFEDIERNIIITLETVNSEVQRSVANHSLDLEKSYFKSKVRHGTEEITTGELWDNNFQTLRRRKK